jgi:Ca-activated chloride channel family protein
MLAVPDFEFALPWVFLALPLPLLFAWLAPRAEPMQPASIRIPFYAQLHRRRMQGRRQLSLARLLVAVLAWVLLLAAAARPQSLDDPVQLPVVGRNLMLAVDISGSMEADDMLIGNRQLTRLQAVKIVAGDFIERRIGDRLGLILFGERAYLQAPLTLDRQTVRSLLEESAIGLAGKNTAIGDAIGLAVKRLRNEPDQNRVLILLTDGSNTAGIDPLKAADLAAGENIRIYTIGVGSDSRVMRSVFGLNRVLNAEIDEETLRAISSKTGGRYFRARDIESLAQIYNILDQIEPVAEDTETYRPVNELYYLPLTAAFLLSLLLAVSRLFSFAMQSMRLQWRGEDHA